MKQLFRMVLLLAMPMMLLTACMKDFLDIKRDKSQVIPERLVDYQAILDNYLMNYYDACLLGEVGSDDYFITSEHWQALSDPVHKNAYVWADEIYQGERGEDWNRAYEKILYANFVLEGIDKIEETPADNALRNELMGASHFYRGKNLFLLAQLFCNQYDKATASETLGLPLRISPNINLSYKRASLEETYRQIIADLELAAQLLPENMSVNTRPWKAAAYGMLANVYLQMGEYQLAFDKVDMGLALASELMDYNELDVEVSRPFPSAGQGNREIIFYSVMDYAEVFTVSRLNIDTVLYDSYSNHDLRKRAFFRVYPSTGGNTFKGHYSGSTAFFFSGITTAEMLLVRMECSARLGNIKEAIADLNLLRAHRVDKDYFEPMVNSSVSQEELLKAVLLERRQELVFRGRRWRDLKRFDKDPNLAKPLNRRLGDNLFTLPLNSLKWVWPIPPAAVNQGGIIQNER